MTANTEYSDLLAPISAARPAGNDALDTAEWGLLQDARQEEAHNPAKAIQKVADWRRAEELASKILSEKSKDLRVAVNLLEAKLRRRGLAGLLDGLHVLRLLVFEYWDKGLYPFEAENILEYRARPLVWLNERMPQLLYSVPLIIRTDGGENYSYARYLESLSVGYEKDIRTSEGDGGFAQREGRKSALANGKISGEMFDAAVAATRRGAVEEVVSLFDSAAKEFRALEELLAEKFLVKSADGDVIQDEVPDLSQAREVFRNIRNVLEQILQEKQKDEPTNVDAAPALTTEPSQNQSSPSVGQTTLTVSSIGAERDLAGWDHATKLIADGAIPEGLAEMTRLASMEHGRVRFYRRLTLAEICLQIRREKLATAILEELNEQIKNFKLEQWESAELIGRVWGNLYHCYRKQEASQDKAVQLHQQLCRLDPWQALRWEE